MVYAAIFVAGLIVGLLSVVPLSGALIALAFCLAVLFVYFLLPLFVGLVQAAFYEEINANMNAAFNANPTNFQQF